MLKGEARRWVNPSTKHSFRAKKRLKHSLCSDMRRSEGTLGRTAGPSQC